METLHTLTSEKNNLELHVDLCAERYKSLDERLGKVETKLDAVIIEVKTVKDSLTKTLITASTPVIVAIIGLIGTILVKF
jgi:hypothetical protein